MYCGTTKAMHLAQCGISLKIVCANLANPEMKRAAIKNQSYTVLNIPSFKENES